MDQNGLTPRQEEYFRTLAMMDPEGNLRDSIADAKKTLRHDNVVRGLKPTIGFKPNGG